MPIRCIEADWFNGRTPGSEPEDRSSILLSAAIGLSSNGRTQDFDSCGVGSSPADPGRNRAFGDLTTSNVFSCVLSNEMYIAFERICLRKKIGTAHVKGGRNVLLQQEQ